MYYPATLLLKSYKPLTITDNMWIMVIYNKGTRFEKIEIIFFGEAKKRFECSDEQIIQQYGYPVEPYIIDGETEEILATPDQIGWWDDGEDTDELYDITLKEVNKIINDFDCDVSIDITEDEEGELFTTLYLDKITLSYPFEEEYEEDDYYTNEEVWLAGEIKHTESPKENELSHLVEFQDDYYWILTDSENQLLYPHNVAVSIEEDILN